MHFVFNFIKGFFDLPAFEVEVGNDAGWDAGGEVGEEGEGVSVVGTDEGDAADHTPLAVADHFIAENAGIVGAVFLPCVGQWVTEYRVGFLATEEVDAVIVFPFVPLLKVDASTIPDVEDFLPFGGSLAQGGFHSLEDFHVVGFLFDTIAAEC